MSLKQLSYFLAIKYGCVQKSKGWDTGANMTELSVGQVGIVWINITQSIKEIYVSPHWYK